MRVSRRLLAPVLATALSCAGVLGLAGVPGARADSIQAIPNLTNFHQMVVDSADGHVFLSEGTASTSLLSSVDSTSAIVVTDLTGNYVTTLDSGDGVEGLALHGGTLYAALAASKQIAVIDAATLTRTSTYALPTGDRPYGLAVQSGKLWVSYNDNPGGAGAAIGDVGLPSGTFTAASTGGDNWYSAPDLAADPSDTGVLLAVQPDISPADAATYNTAVTPVTLLAGPQTLGTADDCSNEQQIAVAPGGGQVLTACGAPYVVHEYAVTNLTTAVHSLDTGAYPEAVAVAPDGTVAAGNAATNPAIHMFAPDGTALNTVPLTEPADFPPGAFAWSADGSKLYAITTTSTGAQSYSLQVFDKLTLTQSAMTLSGPASAVLGTSVKITGSLTFGNSGPAGLPVAVSRANPGATVTTLPAVTTGASGQFTINDAPPAAGSYTYTASYAGTGTLAPAQATATVTVTLNTAAISLSGPVAVPPGKGFSIGGKLTFGAGIPAAGTAVSVSRKNPNGSTTALSGVKTGANGAFGIADKLSVPGGYTYSASYPGNATTAAAKATHPVKIARVAAPLTLTPGASTVAYNSTIKVQAHLGGTSNRTVSLYYQFVGSGTRVLLKTGKVDSSGNLHYDFKGATRNVYFTATFSGDAQYLPLSVSHRIGVGARVSMTNGGYYTSNTFNGVTYRVYHHTAHLTAAVTVTPNKHGECVRLAVQELINGAWVVNVTSGCATLNSSSKASGYLILTNADLGFRFRVRAVFYPGSKDLTNASYPSSWFYFQVVT